MKLFRNTLRFFALFLALQVLLSHTGMAVNIHTCLISGKSFTSLTFVADCCAPDADSELLEWLKNAKCCSSDTDFKKVNSETSPEFAKIQLGATDYFPIEFLELVSLHICPSETDHPHHSFQYTEPPLPYGRDLLANIQVYLI